MVNGLLFKKIKMSQVFNQEGVLLPITILKAPQNIVSQIKTLENDGYWALQLTSGEKKRANKPQAGHLQKAGFKINPAQFTEFRLNEEAKDVSLGQKVKVEDVFSPGELVLATGISKGRGFAGVVKRWGFATQPKTHGQSDRERAPGSIGAQTPGRVFKGKKMPGHFGAKQITTKNLLVLKVIPESQELWVRGAVPGHNNSWIRLKKTGKKKNVFVQLEGDKENEQKSESKE